MVYLKPIPNRRFGVGSSSAPEVNGFSDAVSSGIGGVLGELGASKYEEMAKRNPIPIKSARSNQAIIMPKPILSETLDDNNTAQTNETVVAN